MKNLQLKSIIQYIVSISIAGLLLWYIFSIVDFNSLLDELKKANYVWIGISIIISIIAHISRGIRWKLLLEPLGYHTEKSNLVKAVLIGYLANYAVPRLGEVARCGIIKRTNNVPVNVSFGTVITERVVDLVALLIIFGLSFLLEFVRLKDFFISIAEDKFSNAGEVWQKSYIFIIIFFVIAIGALFMAVKNKDKLLKISFIAKVYEFVKGLIQGLLSITKLKKKWEFVFHSILIWVCYYLMTYVIFFSMKDTATLPPASGLVVLTLASLGMTAPVQGGIGAFHFMVATGLLIYGIPQERGLILATILHASQFVAILIFGGISLISVALSKPKNQNQGDE